MQIHRVHVYVCHGTHKQKEIDIYRERIKERGLKKSKAIYLL